MKNGFFFFLFLILCSCHQNSSNNKIQQFKAYIGEANSKVVDRYIESMEKKLEQSYQTGSATENYKMYLSKVLKGGSDLSFDSLDYGRLRNYELSGLERKFSRIPYDTVLYKDGIYISIDGLDSMESIIFSSPNISPEVEIQRIKKRGNSKLIHSGLLMPALQLIAQGDTLIEGFVDAKIHIGIFPPRLLANYILSTKIDFSKNYFYKLILLHGLYYPEVKRAKDNSE